MSRPLRVFVVEDEPLARQRVVDLLAERQDVELVGEAGSRSAASGAIPAVAPDLLLLDVKLPDGDGFDVLQGLDLTPSPLVVFVTAFEQHAVEAFEVHAFDYLLKPFDRTRFHEAVDRAVERLRQRREEMLGARLDDLMARFADPGQTLRRIAVRKHDRLVVVPVEEVLWIEAARNYAQLHTERGSHLVRFTMDALERILDPKDFARVHRSAIVNLGRVRELHPLPGGDFRVVLEGGAKVRMSRNYRGVLDGLLEG